MVTKLNSGINVGEALLRVRRSWTKTERLRRMQRVRVIDGM